jgi:hypothetical protein
MLDESDHFHSVPRNIVRFNVGNVPISFVLETGDFGGLRVPLSEDPGD